MCASSCLWIAQTGVRRTAVTSQSSHHVDIDLYHYLCDDPVWNRVYTEAIEPYTQPGSNMSTADAWEKGSAPSANSWLVKSRWRTIMTMFTCSTVATLPDSPVLPRSPMFPSKCLPCIHAQRTEDSLSHGLQIYLPFLILDVVIASVTCRWG